jgi:hypothetical protein
MSKARDLANAGTALTTVSATELGYLDGVTSAVQTQIDSKIGSASAINPTIVDAKGDIIAASAADTVARLAVGANDTVLTADSTAATGLKWATPAAGGMTLLSTTTLSGASTTISSISQSYNNLQIVVYGVTTSGGGRFLLSPNGTDTGTWGMAWNGSALEQRSNDYLHLTLESTLAANANNSWTILIENYSSTSYRKNFFVSGGFVNSGSSVAPFTNSGMVNTTSAISSLKFSNAGGNLSTGTVLIYGVK